MPVVDIVPANRNTATNDRAIAISYEITCADERSPPSSEYGDIDDQPASTIPYTPIDDIASTSSTATGRSVPCSAVWWPKIDTVGPNGMMTNEMNAGTAATIGASTNTTLSTW